MIVQTEFDFKVDRDRAINSIISYWELPPSDEVGYKFNHLLEELRELSSPIGIFRFIEKPSNYNFSFLENCQHMFFSVVTLGDNSTRRVNELFNQGKMFDAILLDAMESVLLFEYINQFQQRIILEAGERGMGITCRICPGDGEIPIEYQGDILERIGEIKHYGINIFHGYLLNPSKSISFVHGADRNIILSEMDSGCGKCLNKYCNMRK